MKKKELTPAQVKALVIKTTKNKIAEVRENIIENTEEMKQKIKKSLLNTVNKM